MSNTPLNTGLTPSSEPRSEPKSETAQEAAITVAANIVDALRHPGVRLCDSARYYKSKEALPLLIIETQTFLAVFAIQGAQLLEFNIKPSQKAQESAHNTQEASLIWLSPQAIFTQGKAVRGGIPLCFPWFGAHPSDTNKPSHGFVRGRNWQLQQIKLNDSGQCKLTFSIINDQEMLALYPYAFKAQLEFNLSEQIDITFSVDNLSQTTMPCTWALHSYLPIQDIDKVSIDGLEGRQYLNTVGPAKQQQQQHGSVRLSGEVDRIYQQVGSRQLINSKRALEIHGENCPSAIVWNPGTVLAAQMADLGISASREFICLERGAALNEGWNIPANGQEVAKIRIKRV